MLMAGNTPDRDRLPKKILMTTDAIGGVWQYALDLIEGLVVEGITVLLAALGPPPSQEQIFQLQRFPTVTFVHRDNALEWMQNPWRDVDAAGEWLLKLQAEFQPDLIHLNGFSHASLPWGKPVLIAAHSCVFSWWRSVHGSVPSAEWHEYKRRVTAGFSSSDLVVAPSSSMARSVQEEYSVPAAKVKVIPNFSRMSSSAGKPKEAFFLAAGRLWDPAKNLSLLDKIAPELDWPVLVAGSNQGPEESAATVQSLHMLGVLSREQMVKKFQTASIFVHPALYEPFGLAVLEAARSRCCLALSNIPSLRELWAGAAIFLDPRDPDEWKFELNALCRDFARRDELAKRAFKHAQRYEAAASISAYLEAYRLLLAGAAEKEAAA